MWRPLSLAAGLALLGGCALLEEAEPPIDPHGYDAQGVASYYGAAHQGQRTASGERFDQNSFTAAHRQLPFGSKVLVTNLANQKTVVVRINDRGPHTRSRLIDLSRAAAEQLSMVASGIARVRIQDLDD